LPDACANVDEDEEVQTLPLWSAFKSDHQITIEVDFGSFVMKMDERGIIKLQIWDTAGQDHFQSITKLFYKNSQAAQIVYDVTKRESIYHVRDWLHEIEENRDQDDMLVYLVPIVWTPER
jgi:GTPase SAR1 family protein